MNKNKLHKHFKDEAARVHLSDIEKRNMRIRLENVMDVQNARVSFPMSRMFTSHPRVTSAVSSILSALVIMSGTAYAAERTVPGDTLYPVKINVNEAVKVMLARTTSEKAAVNIQLAERRINEAKALAERGELNVEKADVLRSNFETHAEAAIEYVQEIVIKNERAGIEVNASATTTSNIKLNKGAREKRRAQTDMPITGEKDENASESQDVDLVRTVGQTFDAGRATFELLQNNDERKRKEGRGSYNNERNKNVKPPPIINLDVNVDASSGNSENQKVRERKAENKDGPSDQNANLVAPASSEPTSTTTNIDISNSMQSTTTNSVEKNLGEAQATSNSGPSGPSQQIIQSLPSTTLTPSI